MVSALWIASFPLAFTLPLLNRYQGTDGIFVTYAIICLPTLRACSIVLPSHHHYCQPPEDVYVDTHCWYYCTFTAIICRY